MQTTAIGPKYPQAVPQCLANCSQPSYNAVKIDIHNPQVNAPSNTQNPIESPIYSYPESKVYDMPQQSIYEPKKPAVETPPAIQEAPAVPQPVIIPPTINQAPATTTVPTAAPVAPVSSVASVAPVVAPAQKIEIKAPEVVKPQIDVNEFIAKLNNPDFEQQATTMEAIAEMAQSQPQKATELLDVKVIDTLLGIMNTDSSKLEGPTPKQLEIREKIIGGKAVTEAETAEASKITPMEQAERNKQYSMYTVAILQKLYGSEIEKLNSSVIPMTELPGAAGIVEQVKKNPNPMVRAAGIDALSYIQRPEYKQDLTTLFTVAQTDKDVNVQLAAKKALEKLAQVAEAPAQKPAEAPQPVATKA